MATGEWLFWIGYGWLANAAILYIQTHLPEPRKYEITKKFDDFLTYLMPIPWLPMLVVLVVIFFVTIASLVIVIANWDK